MLRNVSCLLTADELEISKQKFPVWKVAHSFFFL